MTSDLAISIGQHSDKGRKESNQDFHGALIPDQPSLGLKGITIALADGISSSNVSQIAAESAIKSFLTDYYCTSDSWSVKTSAQRVIAATNAWLYSQTRRSQNPYDKDKGYVCTLSVLVLKSAVAHIFHIGDTRIYRVSDNTLEQLTNDHRVAVSSKQNYLSRALGVNAEVEIDYRMLSIDLGDVFVLATDGVYEHVDARFITGAIREHSANLDTAAQKIVGEAYRRGSSDNLTVQIVRIDELPRQDASDAIEQAAELPLPPLLEPRMIFDGYNIVRQLHASSRSHIYLAVDTTDAGINAPVALKLPSIDLRGDPAYLKRFLMEEWIARRIDSAHVLKGSPRPRKKNFLYVVTEFIDGQTLTQWMIDNPKPNLERVREIVEQIAKGLRAFHRKEMLHQDLRPDNIMIDRTGTVKIIDFGSTRVAGVAEARSSAVEDDILGTVQYTAPEYFLGELGLAQSDMFSLGVIAYQMLTGRLPYGAGVARARTKSQMNKLVYAPASGNNSEIPAWVDGALRRAVHLNPHKRYEALSEFLHDLRNPNSNYLRQTPFIERNPFLVWQALSLALFAINLILLYFLNK